MIEKLQKVNDQDPQLDLNQKYFKFINKYKNLSSPLKCIDIQNKDTHFESFGLRKFSTEIRNFNPPKELSHEILLDEKSNVEFEESLNKDQLEANEFIFKRAMKILDHERNSGKCFEHSLAHIKYMDLQMKNAEKMCKLSSINNYNQ